MESYPQTERAYRAKDLAGSVFVGRQHDMVQLKSALEDTLSGQGRLVMLVGEPGIGKTRTAQELAAHAAQQGAQVLWGWSYEEAGAPPYWPWVQPIRSYVQQCDAQQIRADMGLGAADIAEIIPEIRHKLPDLEPSPALEPEQARFRLFDSITTFLKNASQTQPLMLVLDDLHWADRSSLLLLEFIAREISKSHLLLIGTYRQTEVSQEHPLSHTVGNLIRQQDFLRVQLQGMTPQEVEQLLALAIRDRPSPHLVEAVHGRTEGNPLFVIEIIRMLRQEGLEEGQDHITRIPSGVRDAIGRRLSRLSQRCNQVLTTASVIGKEFDFKLLAALSDVIAEEELLAAIDEALAAHLIEESSGGTERYRFSHALIQEVLSKEISASRKVRLHARIGEALEELYGANTEAHAGELAYHFLQAASVLGAGKLVHYSLLAGEQALNSYAYEEAMAYFQQGLEAKEGQPMDAETAALLFGLGRAQMATRDLFDQGAVVVATLSRAFDYYEASGDIAQAVAIAEYRIVATDICQSTETLPVQQSVGARLIDRALALVPPDSHAAGRLLSRRIRILGIDEGNYPAAQEAAERVLAIARREQDEALELWTLAVSASVETQRTHYQEAVSQCEQALALARRLDDPRSELVARDYWHICRQVMGEGPSAAARQNTTAMLRQAERLRDHFSLGDALWASTTISYQEGNWRAARQHHNRALALLPGDPRGLALRIALEHQVGEFGQGEVYLERLLEVMRRAPPGPNMPRSFSPLGVALAGYLSSDTSRLAEAEVVAQSVLSSPLVTLHHTIALRAALGLIAVQRGDRLQCQEQYQALKPHRGITVIGSTLTLTDRVLGLLSHTLGNLDTACEHFEDALIYCRKSGNRPELAWICCDYAETLIQRHRPGDCEKAIPLLDEGLSIASELGMRPLIEQIVALQEQGKSQPGKAPAYPDGLTQREVEVLRLIATGKTDREIADELFISSRTVNNHVRNILNKTAVANRTEAAAFAALHGLI
jgi:DNA-binding CsgD family transcriptional regulator/tetratricopeptide (TPR) repeat protein/DNA polymerase III delta prime subunit